MVAKARVAVIGGSGLYQMEGLAGVEEVRLTTPFGEPSDCIIVGTLGETRVAFLPRHGRGHRLSPSELPYRANIYALKSLGVELIIAVSAVGSLKEDIRPLDMVIPDQLIDRTKGRPSTFFGNGVVAHVPFADPFCHVLSGVLYDSAKEVGAGVHLGGSYIVMEGPAFSTKAESHLYRSWGASIIGMTALPEAKLAREAEMCYAILACATDYDSWHGDYESVSVDMVVSNLRKNVATSKEIIRRVVARLPARRECPCPSSLGGAIITDHKMIPSDLKEKLRPILGKYIT